MRFLLPKLLKGLLLWETIFLIFIIFLFWSFIISTQNIISLLLHAEFLIVILFLLCLNTALFVSLNTLFGLAYLLLILGGLELALSILLLIL